MIVTSPPEPVKANDLRHLFFLVDSAIRNTTKRQSYTADQVQDLLLEVRYVLESLTSPTVLISLAREFYEEAQALHAPGE